MQLSAGTGIPVTVITGRKQQVASSVQCSGSLAHPVRTHTVMPYIELWLIYSYDRYIVMAYRPLCPIYSYGLYIVMAYICSYGLYIVMAYT